MLPSTILSREIRGPPDKRITIAVHFGMLEQLLQCKLVVPCVETMSVNLSVQTQTTLPVGSIPFLFPQP